MHIKGTVHPRVYIFFPLICSAVHLFIYFLLCCELQCFGDTGLRYVYLFTNNMELHGSQLVVLKVPKYI